MVVPTFLRSFILGHRGIFGGLQQLSFFVVIIIDDDGLTITFVSRLDVVLNTTLYLHFKRSFLLDLSMDAIFSTSCLFKSAIR